MAGTYLQAQTAAISTGTSAKTLLQIVAAANHGVKVREWSISFNGSTAGQTAKVDVLRQTTAGTMSSLTPVKDPDDTDETLQTTAQHTATAEPTAGDVLHTEYVRLDGGGYTWQAPPGKEIKIGGGDRLGIRVTSAADVSAVASAKCEE